MDTEGTETGDTQEGLSEAMEISPRPLRLEDLMATGRDPLTGVLAPSWPGVEGPGDLVRALRLEETDAYGTIMLPEALRNPQHYPIVPQRVHHWQGWGPDPGLPRRLELWPDGSVEIEVRLADYRPVRAADAPTPGDVAGGIEWGINRLQLRLDEQVAGMLGLPPGWHLPPGAAGQVLVMREGRRCWDDPPRPRAIVVTPRYAPHEDLAATAAYVQQLWREGKSAETIARWCPGLEWGQILSFLEGLR